MREVPEHNNQVSARPPEQEMVPQEPLIQPEAPVAEPEPVKETPKMREVTLPEEPTAGNAESLEMILRMPQSGERVRRRFLKTDTVGLLYDFVDSLQATGQC